MSKIIDWTTNKTLKQMEIEIVKKVVEKNRGNISLTARQLKIGRNKIYRLIKKQELALKPC